MNPVSVALKGKGLFNFLRRGVSVARHYGVSSNKMGRALAQFVGILRQFGCSATFPIPSVVLERNPHIVRMYQAQGIEFAVHGYRHVDHSQLSQAEQLAHLELAKQAFARAGIRAQGFRSPYLRWNIGTLTSLRRQGFGYDSSQGLCWDVLDGYGTPAYRQALDFYSALSAGDYPSLPSLEENLVRLPYSLPDDEALADRLRLDTPAKMSALWLAILRRTHELGELFTLGLHPERIAICQKPLTDVLDESRRLQPAVWIARLDEIAGWWRARAEAVVKAADTVDGKVHLTVLGPEGITVLVRNVKVDAPIAPRADGYWQVEATAFTVEASPRPFIGLSPVTSPQLASFLRQQGYVVEIGGENHHYSYYFDQAEFTADHKRPLLAEIEGGDRPLVRLGRWPDGARSALAVTGDIDALTLWDYGFRLVGN